MRFDLSDTLLLRIGRINTVRQRHDHGRATRIFYPIFITVTVVAWMGVTFDGLEDHLFVLKGDCEDYEMIDCRLGLRVSMMCCGQNLEAERQ